LRRVDMATIEIEQFAKQIRAATSTAHTIIVDGFPLDGASLAQVEVDADEMLRLLSVLKPRLLYVNEQWFDSAAEIAEQTAALVAGGIGETDISPLSSFTKSYKNYDSNLCLVSVGFVMDSVLHLTFAVSEWYSEFQRDIVGQVERLKQVQDDNLKNSNLKLAAEIENKARELANDPAFNFKPSRDKRWHLAEQKFPTCNHSEIYQIVDKAINLDWLDQARSRESEP
jgi:hypothetical protein